MKDRLGNQIGTKGRELTDWNSIDWERQKILVRNLRQRIFQATQTKQWNKVRSLTKLMLRSQANLLLSVRRVTQENAGKKTPGVDKEVALTGDNRVKLIKDFQGYAIWKARPTRRVYIPKANGKQRPLGIPTIRDRIAQAIVKNALEPTWEARFEANSYGFRSGRSCHDAIEQSWIRLNSNGGHVWVLDADIKGAFDNINHDFILKAIGEIPGKELIKQWLKAGYVESDQSQG
ncbi:reverse transcriptase N-terminal domain-containing protein [Microcoleus sp. AR_TQ3_B6]|uniref:reverse transcriptase N-terminal domain-containing protein n=1 Tax=Microcoleus sp. AR_TQ3_B6 TaxID=3055284 RepID=UPI002FCF41C9